MKRCISITAAIIFAAAIVSAAGTKDTGSRKTVSGAAAGQKTIKIGLAKIVTHPALDEVERGTMDYIKQAGFNPVYDQQNANGDVNTAAQIANQYKQEKVDVAVAIATPIAIAFANSIKDIPVVFGTVTDPIGAGLVSTYDHGENNVTGMCDANPTEQQITLFKEIAGIKTLGYIYTSKEASSVSTLKKIQAVCTKLGLKLEVQTIQSSSEVKQAAESMVNRCDGIYLSTDNTLFSALPALVDVFNRAKKPIFSIDLTTAKNGGVFMAHGFNWYKTGLATGEVVVRILKGEKPAQIPVRFMTKADDFELLFDMDQAKACGITVPQKYLDQANYLIENGKMTAKK